MGARFQAKAGLRLRPARIPDDRAEMLAILETANMDRIPSPEMHDFDVGSWQVAEAESEIAGLAGYRIISDETELVGKTTLLAVHPSWRSSGIGRALQEWRMREMRAAGATKVVTNADRPEAISWYQRHFGYRVVGKVAKQHEFGLADVAHWTTLEAPLR